MQFVVPNNVYTRKGKKTIWLEPGSYPVIRLFDSKRVMLDCSTINTLKRQITIIDLSQGTLNNDTEEQTS